MVTAAFTVHPALLTARAADVTHREGAPTPPLTVLYSGFVAGHDVADLASAPTAATTERAAADGQKPPEIPELFLILGPFFAEWTRYPITGCKIPLDN